MIDYAGTARVSGSDVDVSDTTSGKSQRIAELGSTGGVFDFIVHFDLAGGAPPGVTPVLDLENALSNKLKTTFANQQSVGGSESDYFRASVARSSVGWDKHDKGRFLSRVYWDTESSDRLVTNWFNPRHGDLWMMRTMQYGDTIKTSRTIDVGLGMLRPDEMSHGNIAHTRPISFNRTTAAAPIANIKVQSATTWQNTDQYLTVGTSDRGANYRYSWSFDNGLTWTTETTDTIYDFVGHSTAGSHSVLLKVRDVTNNLSTQASRTVMVQTGTVTPYGNQYVTTKTTQTYTSTIMAEWFDRINTDPPTWPWTRRSTQGVPSNSIGIIWPAGCYTVELRHQDSTATLLRRGRLPITVANGTGCGFGAAITSNNSVASLSSDRASIFGAGPVLSWGTASNPRAIRLYDLMGSHDATQFATTAWLDASSGIQTLNGLGTMTWNKVAIGIEGVIATRFSVAALQPQPYVFGFAVDPDLGAKAADDRSGFDAPRGMVYAYDGESAFGAIVLNSRSVGASAIWQYGATRFSPSDYSAIWLAQRSAGRHLLSGLGDAQFVLSSPSQSGAESYVVLLIEGRDIEDLRQRADAARALLK